MFPFDNSRISERDSKCDNELKKNYEVKVFPGKIKNLLALALSSQHLHFV
jgi:hypothetical protein